MKWIIVFSFVLYLNDVFGKTIYAGASRKYQTIQAAADAADAGDTVLVDPGNYLEKNLVIRKAVFLIGKGRPVLDGEQKYEIISVRATGTVIQGFRLIRSGVSSMEDLSGIKVYDSNHVIIRDNILDDTFFGISLQNSQNCTIENNVLTGKNILEQRSGNGIHCWKSDSLRIIGNKIDGHRDGIYFEFVKHSLIWRNSSTNNLRYGLHFMFSNDDMYVDNVFRSNGSGVSVMYSNKIRMFGNRFEQNWGDAAYGILLKEITDGYIQGNYFSRNTSAVYMEGATRVIMHRNTFENNGWALKIQASCQDVILERNNFLGNTFDVGTNGSLVLNRFNNNYWDKYEGYDLNKDKIGDIPFRPVSMYSMVVERIPEAMILFRTFITVLMDKTEKIFPGLTPENLVDNAPLMKRAF